MGAPVTPLEAIELITTLIDELKGNDLIVEVTNNTPHGWYYGGVDGSNQGVCFPFLGQDWGQQGAAPVPIDTAFKGGDNGNGWGPYVSSQWADPPASGDVIQAAGGSDTNVQVCAIQSQGLDAVLAMMHFRSVNPIQGFTVGFVLGVYSINGGNNVDVAVYATSQDSGNIEAPSWFDLWQTQILPQLNGCNTGSRHREASDWAISSGSGGVRVEAHAGTKKAEVTISIIP